MGKETIIPCAMCAHPQRVDIENFYSAMSEATKIPIEEISSTTYEFVCHDCSKTDEYRNIYFAHKAHAVLGKRSAIIYN
ncbi:hypothetical protein [Pelosinus sp. sgz500959]|uniref:hypothetical protein n=1 Tax=Pelosinus sp. sgz500959 TaxID=3242472 RepID=UPI003670FF62